MKNKGTYLHAEDVENSCDNQTLQKFISFKNHECNVISIEEASVIINLEEFEEDVGFSLQKMKEMDSDTTFYSGTINNIDFLGILNSGYNSIYTENGEKLDFSKINNKPDQQELLSWLVLDFKSVGTYSNMGFEYDLKKISDSVVKITADKGVRYIITKDKENIAGIHIQDNTIKNIYTLRKHRMNGHSKELSRIAKIDFPELKHSDSKTELGNKFAAKVKL